MAQVIGQAAQVKFFWSAGTRSWLNVVGVQGSPILPTIDQTLAESLFTEAKAYFTTSGLQVGLGPTVSFAAMSIRSIHAANLPEFKSSGAAAAGTGTGDLLPLSAAACVTFRTAGAGRSFRGRSYISGFVEGANDATGRIVGGFNTAAAAFFQAFHDAMPGHGLSMAVLSMPRDAVTIPAKTIVGKSGFANPVIGISVRNTKWESQRRRTGRV